MRRFKNILFVIDSKFKNGNIFERIVSLVENNQAHLTIISIVEKLPKDLCNTIQDVSVSELQDYLINKRLLQLETLVSSIKKRIQVDIKVLIGDPCFKLIQEVIVHKRDLIVKMVEKCEAIEKLFDCTDICLLRKCPCPVWLVNSFTQCSYQNILAAVDFEPPDNNFINNELNKQILEMSTSLALSKLSKLHIVYVWSAYGENTLRSELIQKQEDDITAYVDDIYTNHQSHLEKLITEFIDSGGKNAVDYIKPRLHMPKGVAKDIIPELVEKYKIDLVIMGSIGRTGIPGFFLGNTAETILNKVDCSVLTIKYKNFVTPVLEETSM